MASPAGQSQEPHVVSRALASGGLKQRGAVQEDGAEESDLEATEATSPGQADQSGLDKDLGFSADDIDEDDDDDDDDAESDTFIDDVF